MENVSMFTLRNFPIMRAAQILLVLGIIISSITEGFQLLNTTGSWLFAILGVIALESINLMAGHGTLSNLQAGVFYQKPIHVLFFFIVFFTWVGANYKSITLSLAGGPAIQRHYRTTAEPPTLLKEDSVRAVYLQRLTVIDEDIAAQKKTTWKGSITAQAQKNISQLNKERADVNAAMDRDILAIREQNGTISGEWEAKTQEGEKTIFFFAGMGEAIKISCMLIIFLFGMARNQELGIHKIETMLGVDLDGDGHTGTPPAESQPKRAPGYHRVAAEDTNPRHRYHPDAVEDPTLPTIEAPRQPIGFRQTAQPTPAPNPAPNPVATSSYHQPDDDANAQMWLEAYKSAKSTRDSWQHKPATTPDSAATKAKNIAKWESDMNLAEAKLRELGFQVVLRSRRFTLEAI